MEPTPKIADALITTLEAPEFQLTRCGGGFHDPSAKFYPNGRQTVVTRRTANALVNASLADYNDRSLPSSLTLTTKGMQLALSTALASLKAAA